MFLDFVVSDMRLLEYVCDYLLVYAEIKIQCSDNISIAATVNRYLSNWGNRRILAVFTLA